MFVDLFVCLYVDFFLFWKFLEMVSFEKEQGPPPSLDISGTCRGIRRTPVDVFCFSWRNDWYHSFASSLKKNCVRILYSARKSSICCAAIAQSTAVPEVIKNHTSIPCASTARCILVWVPFCAVHCLDFRLAHRRRWDAPWRGWHQSSAIQSLCRPPALPVFFPRFPCPAIGGTDGVHSSSSHMTPTSPARALLSAMSRMHRINYRVLRALPPRHFEDYYITFLLTIPSNCNGITKQCSVFKTL